MQPTAVPQVAKNVRPDARCFPVGPPPGISDDDCGTIEAQVDRDHLTGGNCWRVFWKPTPDEIIDLSQGGCVELAFWAPQLVMHSLAVLGADQ